MEFLLKLKEAGLELLKKDCPCRVHFALGLILGAVITLILL